MTPIRDLMDDPTPALSALTERPAGLFVDFDGTISRLAPTPDEAIASPRAVRSLERLSGKLAVVCVLSGRRAQDIRDKVGLSDVLYAGNHGAESIEGTRTRSRPWPSSTEAPSSGCCGNCGRWQTWMG